MGWTSVDSQSMIPAIQAGDAELRERLLERSLPFVGHEARRFNRNAFIEQEEEYAIALETFNQAIDSFRPERGVPFEAYARLLIRNRLLDHVRHIRREQPTVSLSDSVSEGASTLEETLADPSSGKVQEEMEFREAVFQLELNLKRFGLELASIAGHFPKHLDSRMTCIHIARNLSEDEALFGLLLTKAQLPGAELSRRCGVPVKTIEKNRSSIILLALLLRSELRLIHTYIAFFEKEGLE